MSRRLAALAAAAITACGTTGAAPTLEALEVSTDVRAGAPFEARVRYHDADGDVLEGSAEVALRLASADSGQVFDIPLDGTHSTSGTLTLTVTMPSGAVPGAYELALTVIDGAGRRSAPARAMFVVGS